MSIRKKGGSALFLQQQGPDFLQQLLLPLEGLMQLGKAGGVPEFLLRAGIAVHGDAALSAGSCAAGAGAFPAPGTGGSGPG